MRRLGMRFHKDVQYPLGAGVEYVIHRDDAGPLPKPALISLEGDSVQAKHICSTQIPKLGPVKPAARAQSRRELGWHIHQWQESTV